MIATALFTLESSMNKPTTYLVERQHWDQLPFGHYQKNTSYKSYQSSLMRGKWMPALHSCWEGKSWPYQWPGAWTKPPRCWTWVLQSLLGEKGGLKPNYSHVIPILWARWGFPIRNEARDSHSLLSVITIKWAEEARRYLWCLVLHSPSTTDKYKSAALCHDCS